MVFLDFFLAQCWGSDPWTNFHTEWLNWREFAFCSKNRKFSILWQGLVFFCHGI